MKPPKWLVCSECRTARAGNHVDVPEGWRVIPPGAIHTANHEIFDNLDELRATLGINRGYSFDPRQP